VSYGIVFAKMRRLVELRGRLASGASGESPGLSAVKAEGAAIVAARERDLEREKAASVEPDGGAEPTEEPVVTPSPAPKPKKKRGGRNDDVV
jgi:hypothetical protein